MGDFSTKGEPREASVAVSMLETGNWTLPSVYADEFAFKPPMAHWLMAAASLPAGEVTEFSSRLPSAIAFIVLAGFMLAFFGKRLRFQEAFIATLLFVSCIEIHRAAMTARVDMLLTAFIVIGLFQLYRWEDTDELKGLPVQIPILLGLATLTKGPVGIILPLFVFGVYLLTLRKYAFKTIFKSLLYSGISSLFIPIVWYVAAWKRGGDDFLNLVLAENFGRFFSTSSDNISYALGHENGFFYNFQTLILGFMPWTVLFIFSLFGLKISFPHKSLKQAANDCRRSILSMEKEKLLSLVAIVCVIVFYSIPSSKRSVYLLPAYPFISLFLAQYALYTTEYRRLVTRTFAWFMGILVTLVTVAIGLLMAGVVSINGIADSNIWIARLMTQADFTKYIINPDVISIVIYIALLAALATLFYQLFKKNNLKILYATIALTLVSYLIINGVIMRSVSENTSSKEFANTVIKELPISDQNMFVINNLRKYTNLYGLNFYLGNKFHDLDKANPKEGFFFCTQKDLDKIINDYSNTYTFTEIMKSDKRIKDVRDEICVLRIVKK